MSAYSIDFASMGEITYKKKLGTFISEFKFPILITTLLAMLSVYIHLYTFGSPMDQTEEIWLKRVTWHLEYAPFAHRLLQNYATLLFHQFFLLPIKESFFVVQYILFLLIGSVFYKYLRLLSFDKYWSIIGLIILLTAYPILGAHFSPVYTWDDMWAYLFIMLMLINLIKLKWNHVGLFLLLGLMAREQTIIFVPILIFIVYLHRENNNSKLKLISILLPILIYIIYRLFLWQEISSSRWGLFNFNFENHGRTNDSLMSIFLSFGFIWLLYFVGCVKLYFNKVLKEYKLLVFGSISTLILTFIIALFFAFTRETRLLFPPFVFVIPIALIALKSIVTYKNNSNWICLKYIFSVILLGVFIFGGINYVEYLNIQCDFWAGADVRFLLLGIHLGVATFFIVLYLLRIILNFFQWVKKKFRLNIKIYKNIFYVIIIGFILFFTIRVISQIFNNRYSIRMITQDYVINDKIKIVNIKYEYIDDIPHAILFSFVALVNLQKDYRIYFHLHLKGSDKMINLDFVPYPRVYNWNAKEVISLRREIDLPPGEYKCIVGLFNEFGRMGKPYKFIITL